MPKPDKELQTTPSVLDRLIDYEPRQSKEPPKSRTRTLSELKQAVRRDLEWLLNTKRMVIYVDENLEEVNDSVVVYGLRDLTSLSVRSLEQRNFLIKEVERTIKTFEPRFLNLKVSLEPAENTDKSLRFKIEAYLNVDPAPEPVTFDTVLELGTGDFEVRKK